MCFKTSKVLLILTIIILFSFKIVYAQNPFKPAIDEDYIQQKIEEIAENTEEILDYSDLINQLYALEKNPINLNKASFEDLKQIFFLNDIQIFNLIKHRELYGDYLSLYELQSVDDIDLETIYHILPFIVISKQNMRHASFKEIIKNSDNQLFVRINAYCKNKKDLVLLAKKNLQITLIQGILEVLIKYIHDIDLSIITILVLELQQKKMQEKSFLKIVKNEVLTIIQDISFCEIMAL